MGAAGLWQFTPGTVRRYMRVDSLVDERLGPYTATDPQTVRSLNKLHKNAMVTQGHRIRLDLSLNTTLT